MGGKERWGEMVRQKEGSAGSKEGREGGVLGRVTIWKVLGPPFDLPPDGAVCAVGRLRGAGEGRSARTNWELP